MNSADRHGIEELTGFAMSTIQQLGTTAMAFYGKGNPELRFDQGLVTQAELTLRESFEAQLKAHYPADQAFFAGSRISEAYTHDDSRYLWIYDPIDGVDNFQTGIPIWGSSLALIENFWPILGVFHMPATGDTFHACADGDAYHGSNQISIPGQKTIDDESLLLTFSRFHQQYRPQFPGKIRNLGCTAAHICYVAQGRADAAILANESYKDLAAARVIIEAAGGKLCKMDGSPFFLNEYLDGKRIDEHLIVSTQENITTIAQCLARYE